MTFFWNAGNLYALTVKAYGNCKEKSSSDALAAVVLAVASLEGFINELAGFAGFRTDTPEQLLVLKEIWDDLE